MTTSTWPQRAEGSATICGASKGWSLCPAELHFDFCTAWIRLSAQLFLVILLRVRMASDPTLRVILGLTEACAQSLPLPHFAERGT